MKTLLEHLVMTMAVGGGATVLLDLWTIARRRAFGTPLPDYGLVGRWIAHMADGTFRHERIALAPAVHGERALGWAAHYAIGIAFAAVLVALWGFEWLERPALVPALAVGLGSVAAPFLLMQPGMGAGIAARKTPRPWAARFQSVVTHGVFGLGLYFAAQAAQLFINP